MRHVSLVRRAAAAGALVLGMAGAVLGATPAFAVGGATITHLQAADHGLDVLVSVPAGEQVDLKHVSLSIDGTTLPTTAQPATGSDAVHRTAILLIDTSNSMGTQGRLAAAKQAAKQYVATLPANVDLGIVTFASTVTTALPPTSNHSLAGPIIDGLTTSPSTLLYDGVKAAVAAAGTDGQRSVLLLTDGKDVGSTGTLADAVSAVKNAGVLLDAVGLHENAAGLSDLTALAGAGQGVVLNENTSALQQRFVSEASVLARQVLVTAQFPSSFTETAGQVTVSLPSSTGSLTASAVDTSLQAAAPPASSTPAAAAAGRPSTLPGWVVYAGAGAIGVGVLALLLALIPKPKDKLSPEERVASYAAATSRARSRSHRAEAESEDALATAKSAAAGVLRRNASLEARIAARLEGAGSELKPAEWLLLHVGIAFLAGVVGLVVGHGIGLGIAFLALGIVGPWFYLGFKKGRRRKAFAAMLPDTLQLMSGSLAAGLSLAQSVDAVVREGSDPIASEFRRVMVEARLGVNLEDALEGISERFDSDDFRWVVMAIRIQRQVGGNLAELLDTVAATMRERQYLRRQVASLAAEGKMSAWVIGALPPLFMGYLLLTNPTYIDPLFTDPRGLIMLFFGVGLLGVGVFWMSRLVKVDV